MSPEGQKQGGEKPLHILNGVVVENQTSVYLLHSLKNVCCTDLLWPANVLGKQKSRQGVRPSTLSFFRAQSPDFHMADAL